MKYIFKKRSMSRNMTSLSRKGLSIINIYRERVSFERKKNQHIEYCGNTIKTC